MLSLGLWDQWIRMESWKHEDPALHPTSHGVSEEELAMLSFRNDGIYLIFVVTTLLCGVICS